MDQADLNTVLTAGIADLSELKTVLESGVIYDDVVPFSVRLAALGPYNDDGDTGQTLRRRRGVGRLGEAGAGQAGAVVNPGHMSE